MLCELNFICFPNDEGWFPYAVALPSRCIGILESYVTIWLLSKSSKFMKIKFYLLEISASFLYKNKQTNKKLSGALWVVLFHELHLFLFFLCSSNTFSLISYSTYAVEYLICSVELSLVPNLHFSSISVHVSALILLIQNSICSDTTYSETFLQFPIFSSVCPRNIFCPLSHHFT